MRASVRPSRAASKRISKAAFKEEIAARAKSMRVKPLEVHIRPMSSKWGSCSTRGRVTFNSDLLSAPAQLRREVIVEELLHLKLPNHGALFKALKRAYLVRR